MKVKIVYDINKIKNELFFIENNLAYFKKNKMFFYFPFESIKKTSDKKIIEQMHKDEKRFKIKKIKEKIEKKWEEKENSVFEYLYKYNKKGKNLEFENEYKCYLSFYGCYGYYDFPNEIFVNINAKIEFIIETIIHELIHLLIYKKTAKKPYQEIEKIVDEIFINSRLNMIFPKYEKQKIAVK